MKNLALLINILIFISLNTPAFSQAVHTVNNNLIALGRDAGTFTTGLGESVFIGNLSGQNSGTFESTYLGRATGQNAVGSRQIAIGSGAGRNSKGNRMVSIGITAGVATAGDDCVYIGRHAGRGNVVSGQFIAGFAEPGAVHGITDVYFGSGRRSQIPIDYTIHGTAAATFGISKFNTDGGRITIAGGTSTGSGDGGDIAFRTASGLGKIVNPTIERMIITDEGNIGIGTSSPQTLLHLVSNVETQVRLDVYDDANGSI
ncbi:MAG: hypothetical protein JKX73_10810, partial [Flavobacteriales bacterium]|nr:hypothetical protein [Flavobacteriales bacterium]